MNADIKKIVIATQNSGKATEIKLIMKDIDVEFISLDEKKMQHNVQEDGDTFQKNADIKSIAYNLHTGLPALGDDSGLEVDALNGAPGLHSNRYYGINRSDREKYLMLLKDLKDISWNHRTARFRCAAALADCGKVICRGEGIVEGRILFNPRGEKGFGFDPVFLYEPLNKSFAELQKEEKSNISHRGRALKIIKEFLLRKIS